MMKSDLDYPLPATAIELLLALVDTAKQYQIQIIPCREVQVLNDFGIKDDRHLSPQSVFLKYICSQKTVKTELIWASFVQVIKVLTPDQALKMG